MQGLFVGSPVHQRSRERCWIQQQASIIRESAAVVPSRCLGKSKAMASKETGREERRGEETGKGKSRKRGVRFVTDTHRQTDRQSVSQTELLPSPHALGLLFQAQAQLINCHGVCHEKNRATDLLATANLPFLIRSLTQPVSLAQTQILFLSFTFPFECEKTRRVAVQVNPNRISRSTFNPTSSSPPLND